MTDVNPGTAQERFLPDGAELARLRALPKGQRPTLAAIGEQYGVSRQAVHKAIEKWRRTQKTSES